MKTLYFDTFSGISGDMVFGAFINAGMGLDILRNELLKIPLKNFDIQTSTIKQNSISATKFDVVIPHHEHVHRNLSDVYKIIDSSTLNDKVKTAFFISDGNNMILQNGVPPNAQLKNSGIFTHKGIELSGKYFISDRLLLNLNYTYLDPDKQTKSSPRHKFYVETVYNISNFNISLNLKQISKLYGEDESRLVLPDYTLLNCNVSYSPVSFLSIYVAGNNLLNQEYQTMYGYVMPKSTYMIGLNINY